MALQDIVLVCCMFVGSVQFSTGSIHLSQNGPSDEENLTGLTTVTTSPLTTMQSALRVYMNRANNRELRLQNIRREILQRLGWTEPPKINSQSVADVRLVLASEYNDLLHANQMTEERRCFSSSCNLPRNINPALWYDPGSKGWRMFTGGTARLKNNVQTVETAQLKLFMRIPEGFRCNNTTNTTMNPSTRFLVSVYQFVRPLRVRTQRTRRRIQNKKRMIDARMVGAHNHWVSLNVKTAVADWISERRNNYGFEIGVKDDNENECNATAMFVPVNCASPVDIGCVEEDVNTTPILPWVQANVDENFPYLEVSHKVRRRSGRDTRHVLREQPTPAVEQSTQCHGIKTIIHIKEKWIVYPRNFTSLNCSGPCSNQSIDTELNHKTCHPTSIKQVEGIYLNHQLHIQNGLLPYRQVLECGC